MTQAALPEEGVLLCCSHREPLFSDLSVFFSVVAGKGSIKRGYGNNILASERLVFAFVGGASEPRAWLEKES